MWLELVVLDLQPFYMCHRRHLIKHVRAEKICILTLSKYMNLLTQHVEKKVSKDLPQKFALVFEGWSACDCHYVSILATIPKSNKNDYLGVLLAFLPLVKQWKKDEDEQINFIHFVLDVFETR